MSTVAPPMPSVPDWFPSLPYRLTLEQYERMAEDGILGPRDHVHLIDGFLVAKMTQNDPHCTADELCGEALRHVIPPGWHVRTGKPIRLPGQNSKPEPDRCVVRGTIRDYSRRTPGPADVGLVVEIADSSLRDDRAMVRVYGPAGIPAYWIVNLVDRQIEVYTEPGPGGYAGHAICRPGDPVPVVIDGHQVGRIAVDDILPSAAESNGA